jgi:hypothetical protein
LGGGGNGAKGDEDKGEGKTHGQPRLVDCT